MNLKQIVASVCTALTLSYSAAAYPQAVRIMSNGTVNMGWIVFLDGFTDDRVNLPETEKRVFTSDERRPNYGDSTIELPTAFVIIRKIVRMFDHPLEDLLKLEVEALNEMNNLPKGIAAFLKYYSSRELTEMVAERVIYQLSVGGSIPSAEWHRTIVGFHTGTVFNNPSNGGEGRPIGSSVSRFIGQTSFFWRYVTNRRFCSASRINS